MSTSNWKIRASPGFSQRGGVRNCSRWVPLWKLRMELPKGFQGVGLCRRPIWVTASGLVFFDHGHKVGGWGQPRVTFWSFFDHSNLMNQQTCLFKTFFFGHAIIYCIIEPVFVFTVACSYGIFAVHALQRSLSRNIYVAYLLIVCCHHVIASPHDITQSITQHNSSSSYQNFISAHHHKLTVRHNNSEPCIHIIYDIRKTASILIW